MDFQTFLSSRGLNTLIFTDPYAKLCLTALVASSFQKAVYIDLDTTFAAYLQSGLIKTPGRVDVFLPSEGRLTPLLKEAVARIEAGSVVIFDSVNSFYNLFPTREKTLGGLNHLLSILLMLLVRRASEVGVPVLATSMLRYRKDKGWVQSPASKRFLQTKSAVKLKIESSHSGKLVVTVLQHDIVTAGSELALENGAVIA